MGEEARRPYFAVAEGMRLAVRVTPRSSRTGLAGVVEDWDGRPMLSVRLAAPPVDGAANEALIAFVAKALRISRSQVRIASGETSRHKLLDITDADEPAVKSWIGL